MVVYMNDWEFVYVYVLYQDYSYICTYTSIILLNMSYRCVQHMCSSIQTDRDFYLNYDFDDDLHNNP